MRKMRICTIFSCCLALLLALAACGGSDSSGKSDSTGEPDAPQGYEGTWRHVSEGTEYWLELGKNGRIFQYDVQLDLVTTGSWVETEEGVLVTREFLVPSDMEFSPSMFELPLIDNGEGDLLMRGVDDMRFTRAEDLEVPRTTVTTLNSYRWIDPESEYELEFYWDGSWEIYDSEYDTLEEGDEDGTAINGYAITLTTLDGEELELELSEEGTQITGYKGMTFVRGDLLAGREDEDDNDEDDDEAYQETSTAAFIGCWAYQDYYVWVDIREDGTYQWVDGDNVSSGSYTMEEDELVLDNGLCFVVDGAGGLLDSDGDALFPSTLPNADEGAVSQITIADFVGCWEYTAYDNWICIFGEGSSTGTYDWYQIDGLESSGSCYMDGETLYLEGINLALTLDGEGGLIDSDGDTLFASQLPDSAPRIAALSAA